MYHELALAFITNTSVGAAFVLAAIVIGIGVITIVFRVTHKDKNKQNNDLTLFMHEKDLRHQEEMAKIHAAGNLKQLEATNLSPRQNVYNDRDGYVTNPRKSDSDY